MFTNVLKHADTQCIYPYDLFLQPLISLCFIFLHLGFFSFCSYAFLFVVVKLCVLLCFVHFSLCPVIFFLQLTRPKSFIFDKLTNLQSGLGVALSPIDLLQHIQLPRANKSHSKKMCFAYMLRNDLQNIQWLSKFLLSAFSFCISFLNNISLPLSLLF